MPARDPEEYRKYQREQMRRRRAEAKQASTVVIEPQSQAGGASSPPPPKETLPKSAGQSSKASSVVSPPAEEKRISPAAAIKTPRQYSTHPLTDEQVNDLLWDIGEIMDTKGWLLLQMAYFNDGIIVLRRDESVENYPGGYPVYTREELNKVVGLSEWNRMMVHAGKKKTQMILL